jgi:hypothetical protein
MNLCEQIDELEKANLFLPISLLLQLLIKIQLRKNLETKI